MTQPKIQPDLPPLVRRSIKRLIRAFAPERIVLFGSYAKDAVRTGSDVDLLLIGNFEGNRSFHQCRARQLASDCFPRLDIVLADPDEIAEARAAKSPFLLSILGRGITIYDRPPNAYRFTKSVSDMHSENSASTAGAQIHERARNVPGAEKARSQLRGS